MGTDGKSEGSPPQSPAAESTLDLSPDVAREMIRALATILARQAAQEDHARDKHVPATSTGGAGLDRATKDA